MLHLSAHPRPAASPNCQNLTEKAPTEPEREARREAAREAAPRAKRAFGKIFGPGGAIL